MTAKVQYFCTMVNAKAVRSKLENGRQKPSGTLTQETVVPCMDLSPLLFAIYLNDFGNHVSQYYNGLELLSNEVNDRFGNGDFEVQLRLYLLLYADNTVILSETPKELQLSLNAVKTYCTK